MPIININTPNLIADLATIAGIIISVEAAAPITFDTLIDACFKLKPTQDCDAMILHDFTDYQKLGVVDLDDVTITIAYGYEGDCGNVEICSGIPFTPNSQYVLEQLQDDDCYYASVQIDYIVGPITYTKTFEVSYVKDCCTDSFDTLANKIVNKMNDIADTICTFKKVGRKISVLKNSYLILSNLYWLYCHSKNACNEYEKVYCLYNKMK